MGLPNNNNNLYIPIALLPQVFSSAMPNIENTPSASPRDYNLCALLIYIVLYIYTIHAPSSGGVCVIYIYFFIFLFADMGFAETDGLWLSEIQ